MRFFDKMRQQKLLSLSLLMFTLAIGIVIGTLVNTGVKAARGQSIAPDASPISIPSPVVLGNEFTKLAKKLEPSVVYITADFTPKIAENPHSKSQDDESDDSGQGLDRVKPHEVAPEAHRALEIPDVEVNGTKGDHLG